MSDDKTDTEESARTSKSFLAELEYQAIARRLENEFQEWAKKRFNNTLIVAGTVGAIGINIVGWYFIYQIFWPAIEEAKVSKRLMEVESNRMYDSAEKLTNQANEASSKAEKQNKEASKKLKELEARAKQLESKFADIEADITGSSENVRAEQQQEIKHVQRQINELVSNIELEKKGQNARDFQGLLQKIQRDNEKIRQDFTRNSRYTITVYSKSESDKNTAIALENLRKLGYKAAHSDHFQYLIDAFLEEKPGGLIVYDEASKDKARELQGLLKKTLPGLEFTLEQTPYKPRPFFVTRATETVFRIFIP